MTQGPKTDSRPPQESNVGQLMIDLDLHLADAENYVGALDVLNDVIEITDDAETVGAFKIAAGRALFQLKGILARVRGQYDQLAELRGAGGA